MRILYNTVQRRHLIKDGCREGSQASGFSAGELQAAEGVGSLGDKEAAQERGHETGLWGHSWSSPEGRLLSYTTPNTDSSYLNMHPNFKF